MMTNNFYIDFHVLQTVPPSCVNRDDTNSPKSAVYGGTLRARVSSQSWKHAMREAFKKMYSDEFLAKRTKMVPELVAQRIIEREPSIDYDKALKEAIRVLNDAGIKVDSKTNKLDTLLFISEGQVQALVDIYFDKPEDKKEYKTALKKALLEYPSIDMALFGRMIASDPSLNYDAAAQVAHAISTHEVHTEYDYFTAVDDCSPDDNAGAGHLGTVEYNSSTLYRYASVNVRELFHNLGKETADAVSKFGKAFILSMPTGKQNTFANRTVPDFVYVTVRKDQPVNLSGAFEKAIPASKEGYSVLSQKKLVDYADNVYKNFVDCPEVEYFVGGSVDSLNTISLKDMLNSIDDKIRLYVETMSTENEV